MDWVDLVVLVLLALGSIFMVKPVNLYRQAVAILAVSIVFLVSFVAALPSNSLRGHSMHLDNRASNVKNQGASIVGKAAYAAIAFLGFGALSYCSIQRVISMHWRTLLRDANVIRTIVFCLYVDGMCFIFSSALLYFVWGDDTKARCYDAIVLCLVFYLSGKVLMYLFLVERCHVVRRSGHGRKGDYIYWLNMSLVIFGFGIIAIMSFIWPVSEIDLTDDQCHIGLPFKITLPLLIFDVLINVLLTGQFIFFARRYMRNWVPTPLRRVWMRVIHPRLMNVAAPNKLEDNPADQKGVLAGMAWRTCKAMIIVLSSTVANLTILFIVDGHESGWLCFMMCTIDVTSGIVVLHWLTNEASESAPAVHTSHRHPSDSDYRGHAPTTLEVELDRFNSRTLSAASSHPQSHREVHKV